MLDNSKVFRKIILVGTAPRGGEDIMHLEKPSLAKFLHDTTLKGYEVLQKIFFPPTDTSQAAGKEFIGRLIPRRNYACVAAFALKMPLKLSRYCRKTRIHNTQATRAGAMVLGDIVR
jgi:hypothetical protein